MWGLKVKGQGHWERKCKKKLFFAHIFVKSGSIYIKSRPKWSSAHFAHRRIHFISENASFLWYFSVIIRDGRMSQRPPGPAPTWFYVYILKQLLLLLLLLLSLLQRRVKCRMAAVMTCALIHLTARGVHVHLDCYSMAPICTPVQVSIHRQVCETRAELIWHKATSLSLSISPSMSCHGRHLGFDWTRNGAVRSAEPENPTLERNIKWIGSPVAEMWPYRHITMGALGPPFWG